MNSENSLVSGERPRLGRKRADPWQRRLVLAGLAQLQTGSLCIKEGADVLHFGAARPGEPEAALHVRDRRFWGALVRRGSIGAGEAFARGWWTSADPVAVVRLMARNRGALARLESGVARVSRPALAAYHALRSNTRRGSRANIRAHYDLSNEFFALFLDESMTYSCGVFERADATLHEASLAKIDRLCRKLDLRPGEHLLEIGTGWGAFAIHAAREYGCSVTTTTLSKEQHALAHERVHAAGLEDRITLLSEDYRCLTGRYDKLVSVEMIEAVGHRYFEDYFRQCSKLLKPDGVMALQAITICDQHYERARRSVDFIQRHIFPGSCIPSVTALTNAMTNASDLRLVQLEDIGHHYVPTLSHWRTALKERWSDARALGYDEEFLRLWEFYFCYCEGGFAERHISVAQMLLAQQATRGSFEPATRQGFGPG